MAQNNYFNQIKNLIVTLLLITGCSDNQETKDNINQDEEIIKEVTISIDAGKTHQTIENFGASDAWSCQFIGNWPDDKKNAIADLLFSTDTSAQGNPRGIGLSLWRFNIGAGSAQQGDQSGIKDEWRRAESFLQDDGTYDWQRQAGQRWFLEAAGQRGVDKFLLFPNSPPVQMTRNGKAYASGGASNLAPEQFNDYAKYLATIIKGLQDDGTEIKYISPVNEPQWDWSDGGQEGTPFSNEEIYEIVKALNEALEDENLSTKIDVAEAGKINYLYTTEDKPNRGNQIETFFDPNSSLYIGDFSRIGNVISGHSYFTTSPFSDAVDKREQLATKLASVSDLKFWMSEYCILGDNDGEIEGNGRDLGIDPALYVARVLHNDLVVANATAWHWWLAVSPYDYKDGLVYVDKNKADGNFYDSKLLWALGNYSRFIRPGAKRVSVQTSGLEPGISSLLFSAYLHPNDAQVTTVVVNSGQKPVTLKIAFEGIRVEKLQSYVTSKALDLSPGEQLIEGSAITIEPRSITTLTGKIQ